MIMEETFHYIIIVCGNQCSNRNQQLLLYVKGKSGVEKSWVIKAIHIEFMFLERQ